MTIVQHSQSPRNVDGTAVYPRTHTFPLLQACVQSDILFLPPLLQAVLVLNADEQGNAASAQGIQEEGRRMLKVSY